MVLPLMPKATAVWLIENTKLTFEQIAIFCGIHELEIQGIADGDVARGINGLNPITYGQLTREEIARCETDSRLRLRLKDNISLTIPENEGQKKKRQGRYTPIARRQDKPDAIAWLLKNCSEMTDRQIVRLIGTTVHTIQAVRSKTHWNFANIRAKDPVLLGLCLQTDLSREYELAQKKTQ